MSKEKFGVVRTDNLKATQVGRIYSTVVEDEVLENGMVGKVGEIIDDSNRELRKLEIAKKADPIALVAHPELRYEDASMVDRALEKFSIPAGKPARTYQLVDGDIFSTTLIEPLTDFESIEVGNKVVVDEATMVLKEVETAPAGHAFIGEIIQKEQIGTVTAVGQPGSISRILDFVVIEVKQNQA